VRLPDAAAVLAAAPDLARMRAWNREGGHTGVLVFGPHAAGAAARIEVRAFAPAHGVPEDPVCGSGNGAVAAWLRHTGQADAFGRDFLSSQGAAVGRAGLLRLSIGAESIRVGGTAVTCVEGTLAS
jgi:PhzF family phenazine biosynthesis protein